MEDVYTALTAAIQNVCKMSMLNIIQSSYLEEDSCQVTQVRVSFFGIPILKKEIRNPILRQKERRTVGFKMENL